ncbi:MAG TPA: transporter substrate-binding domain-containing protein [Deltaproteobacteria bacterium]|nr:transporter substrate-binding domain-containing protein [Deltaproteobacteria bacterium]
MRYLFAAVILILSGPLPLLGFSEVRLLIPEFRPYTYEGNGTVQGTGVHALQEIFKKSGVPYTSVVVSSYDMAISETRSGNADGFFPAARKAGRDAFAVFTGPVLHHRWTWFLTAGSTYNPDKASFKPYGRVGTLQNSAMHAWLKSNGYRVTGLPASAAALIVMLKKDSINAILMPEAEFIQVIDEAGEKIDQYRLVVQFDTPLGMYLSKAYIERNPGALEKITRAMTKASEEKKD